jgi:hypothetical protein
MCTIDWTAFWTAVQAVGTLVAIAAAICIGERQARRIEVAAAIERKRQASIIATGLATALYQLQLDTKLRIFVLTGLLSQAPQSGNFVVVNTAALSEEMRLKEVPSLGSMLSWTTVLDKETAQLALLCTQSTETLNRSIVKVLQFLAQGQNVAAATKQLTDMVSQLETLEKKLEQALGLLAPVHGMEGQAT